MIVPLTGVRGWLANGHTDMRRYAEYISILCFFQQLGLPISQHNFRLVHELRGTPCLGLEEVTPDRKSIMASRSFGRPVTLPAEMTEAVATYTARAAEKMRRQRLATASLIVFVETNRFRPDDPQHCASP